MSCSTSTMMVRIEALAKCYPRPASHHVPLSWMCRTPLPSGPTRDVLGLAEGLQGPGGAERAASGQNQG